MKVVLVHDWLIHMRGGEKVLEALAEMWPDAPIYTLFCDREKLSPVLRSRRIVTSFLQHLPGIRRYYRWLLPVLPLVIKTLRPRDADLVFSTSHCVAKGIPVPKGAIHVCYCHTPMRYIWGYEEVYFGQMNPLTRALIKLCLGSLRKSDLSQNRGVDFFISNSENVRQRIRKYYDRDAEVIHPPMDSRNYTVCTEKQDYYLVVSAFVPYKRIDLVIEAFNRLDRDLKVVGAGPMGEKYKMLAKSPRIQFMGAVSDAELRNLYGKARAVLFPTDEDFGIVPLEAQACGTPVIALSSGGALESVKSGVFFDEQKAESLLQAVRKFEAETFNPEETSERVKMFDREIFKQKTFKFVSEMLSAEKRHEKSKV